MPSIEGMLGLISQLDSPYITVHQERCVLVRNRNADCLRCAAACTSGCIHFEDDELVISPDKCIGCGTCATVCPTCALEAHHPADADLQLQCARAMQAADGLACIACRQLLDRARGLYDESKVVRVECLGRVEEALITELVAAGASEICLVRGACETCEHATGWNTAQDVCATEAALLAAWENDTPVKLTHKLPGSCRAAKDGYDKGKRALFSQDAAELRTMGAKAADYAVRDALGATEDPSEHVPARFMKVMDDGTLAHFVPDRRARLLDALATLGQPAEGPVATRLWGHVVIDPEKCTSCRMCAVFCPTGALAKFGEDFQDDGEPFGVEHYPGDCVKCLCCQNICAASAITVLDEVDARDMLEGGVERYEMQPRPVQRDQPHAIWHTMRLMMKTDQVYER